MEVKDNDDPLNKLGFLLLGLWEAPLKMVHLFLASRTLDLNSVSTGHLNARFLD